MMETISIKDKSSGSNNSIILRAKVSTPFKFFHALSTFTSRPEILIPHARSTDIDWDSLSSSLQKVNNRYQSESMFDLLYSSIYHEGKCTPSFHVGELSGSLSEDTIKSWTRSENEFKTVALTRFIHHKPLKDSKVGWTSKINEYWDFENYAVEIAAVIDESCSLPYASFATLKSKYLLDEKVCEITLERFSGLLEAGGDDSFEFYSNVIIPKIFEWMSDDYNGGLPKLSRQRARPISYVINSKYWYFYDLIKSGPSEYIKRIWQECTDPVKFIHEDIGIAAYIASFIYDNRNSKYRPNNNTDNVDILDLGCGNGLLCFFLNQICSRFSKNSSVAGFDVRRRRIWAKIVERGCMGDSERLSFVESPTGPLPVIPEKSELQLQERSIVPHLMDDLIDQYNCSQEERLKRSLWLVGNHSDELTPWIPVLARRMNATGFFIIPCCPYDFFHKYQRQANLPGSSIYQNYIEYVCTIGDKFGYQPTLENLRIPSTKKICLVGLDCSRKFKDGLLDLQVASIMEKLKKGDEGSSLAKFVPRSADSVKVSTNIDRATAKPIIDKIFQLLIKDWEKFPLEKWYAGRKDLKFSDIMSVLAPEDREVLKSKGNGLKTLVKSNRHLFSTDQGIVKLRMPNCNDLENVSISSRDKIKTQECYFYSYHPHGCPLTEELCAYKH